jgi:hypothetical protein
MHIRVGAVALALVASVAVAHAAPVTVFLERDGHVTDDGVEIPRFGGGDRAWQAIVGCVRDQYAPFQVEIVDRRPTAGPFITAVIGGKASLLGLDDRTTNGVGPFDGSVLPRAVVHIFSRVGTGERDVENLCAVTAHEVGHALGLEHERYCGDVMSYDLDRCGARRFIDADAPCGEDEPRACASGDDHQNSYRILGELVGFRASAPADDPPARRRDPEPAPVDPWGGAAPENPPPRVDPWDPGAETPPAASPHQVDPWATGPQDPYADDGASGEDNASANDDGQSSVDDDASTDDETSEESRVPLRHHCQSRNVSRSSVFLNLPADVRGIASTNTKASGSQNFAKRGARKARRSSAVHVAPGFRTTAARGRSLHRG